MLGMCTEAAAPFCSRYASASRGKALASRQADTTCTRWQCWGAPPGRQLQPNVLGGDRKLERMRNGAYPSCQNNETQHATIQLSKQKRSQATIGVCCSSNSRVRADCPQQPRRGGVGWRAIQKRFVSIIKLYSHLKRCRLLCVVISFDSVSLFAAMQIPATMRNLNANESQWGKTQSNVIIV